MADIRKQSPNRYFVYEIADSVEDGLKKTTQDRDEAEDAYRRGYFVIENEVVQTQLATGQKATFIVSTEWTEWRRTNGR